MKWRRSKQVSTYTQILGPDEALASGRCQRCHGPEPRLMAGRLDDFTGWRRMVLCPVCRDLIEASGVTLLRELDPVLAFPGLYLVSTGPAPS